MGLYQKLVVPRMINLVMSNKIVTPCRAEIVPQARGEVLEVGIGSGLNLRFYSGQVTRVRGVDPSAKLLQMARNRVPLAPIPVELLEGAAEALPVESQTVDTVVMTWTLCSTADPVQALSEMRRVLKPGGGLLFVEHGLSPDAKTRTWQNRINRPWRAIAGGCNLNRQVDSLIASAGLQILRLDANYLPGPRILTFTYRGSARRPA